MGKLLENSCAKGCLVYLLALVMIVALTTLGLGGLSAKFGAGAQGSKPQVTIFTTPQQPAPQGSGAAPNAALASTPTPFAEVAPAGLVGTAPQSAPQPQSPPQTAPQVQLPSLPQITGISGDASAPFYIVQAGDTLWGIATRYG